MKENVIGMSKTGLVSALAIIFAVAIAILMHAILPAGVEADRLDSVFVKLFGFPVVSVFYFVLLFLHCVLTIRCFGKNSHVPKIQIGFRFGIAYAILYFFGMQEVVVETSPFSEWGITFVNYQFFMGVGDAIPVLLLCGIIAFFALDNTDAFLSMQALNSVKRIRAIVLITAAFLTERAIGYETGIITSNCNTYPIPCYIWTIVFGIVLGCSYVVLFPVFAHEHNRLLLSIKLALLTIGVNWIIFNSFIGFIFSNAMPQVLLRSGIDVTVFFLSSVIINRYFVSSETWRSFASY